MATDYSSKSEKKPGAATVDDKDLKQVVTAEVVEKKKSLGSKFKSLFFGGEIKSAGRYVVSDVVIPAMRDAVVDTFTMGIERVVYGEPRSRRRGMYSGGNVSYNRPVNRGRSTMLPDQPPRRQPSRVTRRESNDFLIASREEASLVLDTMIECISKYEVVSRADLLELLGHPMATVDRKWGWFSLEDANIRQTREGYLLELPPMEEI